MMDGYDDEAMDTRSEVPLNKCKIKEDGSPSLFPLTNGAALDENDAEMSVDLPESASELLFDKVFGNDVIFLELEKKIGYDDLKNLRLVRRSANNSVVNTSKFSKKTRFVVSWKTLKDGVLPKLQFRLVNVDVHLFRAAGTALVARKAQDAIGRFVKPYEFRKPQKRENDLSTWTQNWDPNGDSLTIFYDLCWSVKHLRVFGVTSVESVFMKLESRLQILPSVHRLLANIEHLEALCVYRKWCHLTQTVRTMKPPVSPADAEALNQVLMHVKQLEFRGCEVPLPKRNYVSIHEFT